MRSGERVTNSMLPLLAGIGQTCPQYLVHFLCEHPRRCAYALTEEVVQNMGEGQLNLANHQNVSISTLILV